MRLRACFFLLALVPVVDCGGSDGHDSPCDPVCDCVKSLGGDRSTCLKECKASANTTSDTCRSQLQTYGYPSCSSHCDAFGSGGAGGSSGGTSGGPGTGGGPAGTGGVPVRDGGGGPAGAAGRPPGTGGVPGTGGGPAGAGGGPPGGAGGGSAGGGAYTLTPCPGVAVTPGNTAGFADCSSICAVAHCVPTDLVGERADTLPDCPDGTSKCVPDAMAEANSQFVFRACANALDPNGQGRCVPICVAGTAGTSRTMSSSGAWATRWTAGGRWR